MVSDDQLAARTAQRQIRVTVLGPYRHGHKLRTVAKSSSTLHPKSANFGQTLKRFSDNSARIYQSSEANDSHKCYFLHKLSILLLVLSLTLLACHWIPVKPPRYQVVWPSKSSLMLETRLPVVSALLTRNNHDLIGTTRLETHLGRRENDEKFLVN